MAILKYPYTNLHELNLDWIIEQLNKEGSVLSVNDKHGMVVLTGEDIPRNTTTPETVAQALTSQGTAIQTVRTQIGTTPLPTTAQSLTGAIAENAQEIADVEDNVIGSTALPTTAQTLTGAIAENAGNISGNANNITTINNKIGNTALPTTAQTLTGAISEVNAKSAYEANTSVSGIVFRKFGSVCVASINTTFNGEIAGTTVFTVPTGFIPRATCYLHLFSRFGTFVGCLEFGDNGLVKVVGDALQTASVAMQITYIC